MVLNKKVGRGQMFSEHPVAAFTQPKISSTRLRTRWLVA
jgi:hypothetical protein